MLHTRKGSDECRGSGRWQCWCLHGAVGATADWRGFAGILASQGIGSRAVDLWRFAECRAMTLRETAAALNAEAKAVLRASDQGALIGYSMGGRIALHALLDPDPPWRAAVIVSAHPGLEDGEERAARRAHDAQWAARCLREPWPDFLAAWDAQALFAASPAPAAETRHSLSTRRGAVARAFVDWSLGAQESLWEKLASIRIPLLWVAGQRDAKFLALAQRAVGRMPRARLAVAPGAGHRVPWEQTEWLARETAGFLEETN
jgi:2-succinyl-6-hydroxy-2,4-cyclohexadiene-1-carboxylate synthase